MVLDARGLECPQPVIMADEALSKLREGIVEILVDNEGSARNLAKFSTTKAFYSETVQEGDLWRVKIVKGYPCEALEEGASRPEEKGLFMVVATDTLGKDEELGKKLMKGLFETMKVHKEVPDTIFFLNTGVKLTTVNEEITAILKEFDAMGVLMFSCGTCLKYFNLESELKVGFRGATTDLVEGMKDSRKTVWIG